MQIPKKTKVFIEQTIRERENAPAIYNNFLTELWRLRLIAARETVEVINSAESTISGDIGQTPIKLAAEVCGLGPVFQLFLIIENMSSRKVAPDLCVLLHCDHRHFLLKKAFQKVIHFNYFFFFFVHLNLILFILLGFVFTVTVDSTQCSNQNQFPGDCCC